MQALMRNRLYFGSQETYQSVETVEEDLGRLLGMPADDPQAVVLFWRKTLQPDIRSAVCRLFEELRKLRS
jgi:hypothetical protein